MGCLNLECSNEDDLLDMTVISRDADDNELGRETMQICQDCAALLASDMFGQPGVEAEIDYVDHDGASHRIGWDGETTYVPVELPDDASDEQIFAVMADAVRQLGFNDG